MNIHRLRLWSFEIWHWLADGKIVFMCILVIVSAIALGFYAWCSEVSIRLAGYFLQLIGMTFAIRGLLSIRAHFGQPLLRRLFVNWLKRFPKWKKNTIIGVGAANLTMTGMNAKAEVWAPYKPDQSLEKKLEGIVYNLETLRSVQREQTSSLDKLKNSHEEHKKIVAEHAKKIEDDIRSDLETLHTSDLITSLVGLVWLITGITLSTMAPEFYQWLH